VARTLAGRGYLVLTYNRRGRCSTILGSCSSGVDDLAEHWKDVVGAYDFVRRTGATAIVLGGASIGAMATFHAVQRRDLPVAGVVWIGGVLDGEYRFDRRGVRRVTVPKLFISARQDSYGGGEAARRMHRWSVAPKELMLVQDLGHGTDLFRAASEDRDEVEQRIVAFVAAATTAR